MQGTIPTAIADNGDAGARNLFVGVGIFFLLTMIMIIVAAAIWPRDQPTLSATREGPRGIELPTRDPSRAEPEPPRARQSGETA